VSAVLLKLASGLIVVREEVLYPRGGRFAPPLSAFRTPANAGAQETDMDIDSFGDSRQPAEAGGSRA
jgi:hypothetical protein